MAVMVERKKWILYKHTCNYQLIKAVALDVKNSCKTDISSLERTRMQIRLAALNLYNARNLANKPLDSINHRINTLEYWMFGYEDDNHRFIFSPLGNLFLKNINDNDKLRKIFVSMLFAIQFQHPGSGTDKEFQLYPFRLILKLITDKRLDGKLYNFEYECLIAFVMNVDEKSYDDLVSQILVLRTKSAKELADFFKKDEHVYVNAVHEWEYFTQTLLSQIGVFDKIQGEFICTLYHPTKANSNSKPTGRKATRGYIKIANELNLFIERLLAQYPETAQPLRLDSPEQMKSDVIKEIYSFYPEILLHEIGESNELSQLLELPKLIEQYSNNPENNTAYLFESILVEGFNIFYNIKAQGVGGAGSTDIECLYLTRSKKFAVESKSTANKLLGINVGRLREHRENINGEYTIIVTPRYVPAARRDILGTPNVIILASTFAEYLYNHIFHDIRNVDYEDFDEIIVNNLGNDISKLISNKTFDKFSTSK